MELNPWYGYSLVLAGFVGTILIRAPHGGRSRKIPVVDDRKGKWEILFVSLVSMTMLIPMVAMFSSLLAIADYQLYLTPFILGTLSMIAFFWLFHRSHKDLGTNWSISLEIRENHSLVTSGVYTYIRHPMYSALFLYSVGQTLLCPNWIAGPSVLAAFTLAYVFRVGHEERMMVDRFGEEYNAYMKRTRRLIPGVY